MWETMYFSDGIGLAAPQIGRAIRLFVIDADPMAEMFPECKGLKQTFINARIVESSEDTLAENEGVSASLVSMRRSRAQRRSPSSIWMLTSSPIVRLTRALPLV